MKRLALLRLVVRDLTDKIIEVNRNYMRVFVISPFTVSNSYFFACAPKLSKAHKIKSLILIIYLMIKFL